MDEYQQSYYKKMLEKDRLISIRYGEILIGVITYYIGSDVDKYVRDDPWSVLEDEPDTGDTCFVDQLITNKGRDNLRFSIVVWKNFINHIIKHYPKVNIIRWNRLKQGVTHAYYYTIRQRAVR